MDAHAAHNAVTAAAPAFSSRPEDIAWFILLLPLIAAAGIALLVRKSSFLAATFSIAATTTAFVLSFVLFLTFGIGSATAAGTPFAWLHAGDLAVNLGVTVDKLSTLMLLVVTGVSALVQVYSVGYMQGDRSFPRFFIGLSLFTFSMLGIVLADNLVMMFIFWELVGVSSWLLIGFWYEKESAADAAKKAFLTNRLGDFGFLLGIIMVWAAAGTVNFAELSQKLGAHPDLLGNLSSLAGLLIFMGAMGKSAQFPLHVWLPDAMEGPTPVSALIHAATMVAAGVYMLCRVFFLYQADTAWPAALAFLGNISALDIIGVIGAFTALIAALMAIQQNDIKRILAYSTLSQLGYMVMAVGCGGPDAAMYHLTTHAGFKAMLFLGAGSVIHACHHEQDIWKMGGLRKAMPKTFLTFSLGTAALAGMPPLSGFYSKDAVLLAAVENGHPVLFGFGVLIAAMTTFYMLRLVLVAFFGGNRSEAAGHAHESPGSMTWPLMILAVPSVALAWVPLGDYLTNHFFTDHVHHAATGPAEISFGATISAFFGGINHVLFEPFNHAPLPAVMGSGALLIGAWVAFTLYWNADRDPLPKLLGAFARGMKNRFYFDEIYEAVFIPLHDLVARLADWFDRWVMSGLVVRGAHGSTELFGRALRIVQSGNLQTYTFVFVAGVALVVLLALK
jgi:NADH-quinone oxidoreductase subunit L